MYDMKTQLKRYYRWRYSGPITVISLFVIGILTWYFITNDIPFYDKFTCPQMMEYKGGDYGVKDMPRYDKLLEKQKHSFDVEYDKCLDQGWKGKK